MKDLLYNLYRNARQLIYSILYQLATLRQKDPEGLLLLLA
jgi:hypothetical protein